MIEALVIADSISPAMVRLLTLRLRYPKFIHGELMTHRVFSRNASSSRAIPTSKLIDEAANPNTRAYPMSWGKNQKGMQADEELSPAEKQEALRQWNEAAGNAVVVALDMTAAGVHKQVVNRILEPFTHINVLVSSTEWDNFFGLRLDKAADPTMRHLALAMHAAISYSIPVQRGEGDWHLPFVSEEERHSSPLPTMIKVSVARCARISYESFLTGRKSSIEEDIQLVDKLVGSQPIHASPAEHQAKPMLVPGMSGNFRGWWQYRQMIPHQGVAPQLDGFPSVEY